MQDQSAQRTALTRADWKLILVLAAVNFTHMVDFVIIMPLGDKMMREFDIHPDQFRHIIAAYGFAAGIASILASFVVDRFDRKRFLSVMYAGFAIGTLFCGLSGSYETMVISRALTGVFGGLCSACIMAVIGDAFPPQLRGRGTAAVMSAFAVASIMGLPLGLMIAGEFGRGAPFVVLAGLSTLVLAGILAWMPRMTGHIGLMLRSPLAEFRRVVLVPNHWVAFVFTATLVLGAFTVASFLGPYLLQVNPTWTEKRELAIIYLCAGLGTLVCMNIVGRLTDRIGKRPVFIALASSGIVVANITTNLPPTTLAIPIVVMTLFMVCAAGRMVPAQAMLIGVAAAHNRGAFMSLNTAVQQFTTGLAPEITGGILGAEADGIVHRFWIVGLVASACAGLSLILSGFIHPAQDDCAVTDVQEDLNAERLTG